MSFGATTRKPLVTIPGWMGAALRPNYKLLSLAAFLALWHVVSLLSPSALLPGPVETVNAFLENLANGSLMQNLGVTIRRVILGFILSMLIGAAVGISMGLSKIGEDAFSYPVLILLSIPSLGYVILGLMWFGINELAGVFVITAIGFPPVTFNLYEGIKNLDMSLVEMARAFRAKHRKIIVDLVLPSLVPYFMAGARYGIGLAWKIAIIAEMMGMGNGVGFAMQYYYRLIRMDQVLAWILVFTLVIIFADRVVLQQLERALTRWRRPVLL